jgi:hypothetical protein
MGDSCMKRILRSDKTLVKNEHQESTRHSSLVIESAKCKNAVNCGKIKIEKTINA